MNKNMRQRKIPNTSTNANNPINFSVLGHKLQHYLSAQKRAYMTQFHPWTLWNATGRDMHTLHTCFKADGRQNVPLSTAAKSSASASMCRIPCKVQAGLVFISCAIFLPSFPPTFRDHEPRNHTNLAGNRFPQTKLPEPGSQNPSFGKIGCQEQVARTQAQKLPQRKLESHQYQHPRN